MTINEVAPPGFGHTKGDKEKGVKKGGTAAAFDRARKEGRFKGSKADMFKLMWWMKNKGGKPKGKPHYKPGTDEKYKKYQEEGTSYKMFAADAQAARDRIKKKIEDRKKKDASFVERQKKGIAFSDKMGKGYIRGGKKVYS